MKTYLAVALIFISFSVQSKTLLVSHKGIWKNHIYAQNTMEALDQALENGFKGIELDVRLTRDHKLVLAHDDSIGRISNCKGKISKSALKNLLRCYVTKNTLLPLTQILVKKVKRPSRFVSLKKVIDKLLKKNNVEFIWIDLKGNDLAILDALSDAFKDINDKKNLSKIMINSVDAKLLTKAKEKFPHIRSSLEGKWGSEPLSKPEEFFDGVGRSHNAVSLNVGIALGYKGSLNILIRKRRFWKLLKAYIPEAKRRNIPTVAWTVNSKKKLKKLLELDMEYLLTDLEKPIQ